MPAMRHDAPTRPSMRGEHVERAEILDEAIGKGAVELQEVAVGPQVAIADEVARILMREQVLASRQRPLIMPAQLRLKRVVEGIARLLEPEEIIGCQRRGIGERRLEIEAAVGVDGEVLPFAHHVEYGLNAPAILIERGAADLHLDDAVSLLAIAPHLALQRVQILAGIVIAAGGIDPDLVIGLAAAIAVGEEPPERLSRDLGDR